VATEAQNGRRVQEKSHFPIDTRVEHVDKETFWRYFVSQVLRLSLLLICEDMPDTAVAGIIMPLHKNPALALITHPRELSSAGPSLIGWLGPNRWFYSFLDAAPSFEEPSDFRLERLQAPGGRSIENTVLIVVQRKAKFLSLTSPIVSTIQRLLNLAYEYVEEWEPCFDNGMRDWVYQATDFATTATATDEVLNGFTDMIVALGGKTDSGQDRWRFCGLLLPQDSTLPHQQHTLFVCAHSQPVPPHTSSVVLSVRQQGIAFRAYQSGHVIYRQKIGAQDSLLAYREMEQSTRSAIAIPVSSEDGLAVAALYIASEEENAFPEADQRALRVITRILEEILTTYQARRQGQGKLSDIIINPEAVDVSFEEFLSEDDFINDLEAFLSEIYAHDLTMQDGEQDASFIVIDIDNQSTLATKYGDRVARNLSRAVGLRLRGQLHLLSDPQFRRLYHVSADRYYLFLNGMTLDEARNRAEQFHNVLRGEYRIDARRAIMGRPMLREGLLTLPDVTVRLGVSCYRYKKLKEISGRGSKENPIAAARTTVMQNFEVQLERGQSEGGDCIISWNDAIWGSRRWSSAELSE
jgi:GGDEF domain-containing protein